MGETTPWWHKAAKFATLVPPPSWLLEMQHNFFLIFEPLLVGLSQRPKYPNWYRPSPNPAGIQLTGPQMCHPHPHLYVLNLPQASSLHSPHPYIPGWQILTHSWRSRLSITFSPTGSSISSSGPTFLCSHKISIPALSFLNFVSLSHARTRLLGFSF